MTAQTPTLVVPPVGHGADQKQLLGCELDGLTAVEDSGNDVGYEKGDGEGAADSPTSRSYCRAVYRYGVWIHYGADQVLSFASPDGRFHACISLTTYLGHYTPFCLALSGGD